MFAAIIQPPSLKSVLKQVCSLRARAYRRGGRRLDEAQAGLEDLTLAVERLREAGSRLTPRRKTSSAPPIALMAGSFAVGLLLGGVAMYFLDPRVGGLRRARVVATTSDFAQRTAGAAGVRTRPFDGEAPGELEARESSAVGGNAAPT